MGYDQNPMTELDIRQLIEKLAGALLRRKWRLAVAESCTGGWVAKCCTDLAGSSDWFDRAFVTYSNAAKQDLLGVSPDSLVRDGAVSEAVARQMATGARKAAGVDVALAVTGIAGPDGGSVDKPVGTVWFAWSVTGLDTVASCRQFHGDRDAIRWQAVQHALGGTLKRLEST